MKKLFLITLTVVFSFSCFSQELKNISLPSPNQSGGKPLMEALNGRQTARSFSTQKLSMQQLSDLLWAAFGINRPESGKRTAPSAVNWQETTIYVCLEEGIYIYDAKKNELIAQIVGDSRKNMGIQGFTADAAVVLAFVADYSKMGDATPKDKKDFYSAVDVGFISQNVYLYCSSEDMSTVVLGAIDRDKISDVLKLNENQKVILTQCVGFPK
ncbi:MAG: SagB/ThcOx family dehydrogenase [Bacteroidales bacterium]|jgi:SagB-type dehydrogenase family enzyme|nr:SagB/ThcOx family dehydrogenase [Bacteroidales bacterium]MDD4215291.1 SagB/ThcOx family dehydrogenase [Bacteroidales bacterium]